MPSQVASEAHMPPWSCFTTPCRPVEGPGRALAPDAGTSRSPAAQRSVLRIPRAYPGTAKTMPGHSDLDVDRAVLLGVPVDLHLRAGLRDVDADPAGLVLAQGVAG